MDTDARPGPGALQALCSFYGYSSERGVRRPRISIIQTALHKIIIAASMMLMFAFVTMVEWDGSLISICFSYVTITQISTMIPICPVFEIEEPVK